MLSSDFENDIKANALQKPASYTPTTVTNTAITAPRIALTKTTFLTPIQKSDNNKQIQQQQKQQHHKQQKQLYTTLTAKQTTPTGTITSTNLGKVVLKDFKGIIKPILANTTSATKTATPSAIVNPLTTTPIATSSKTSGVETESVGGNLNVAIVAAKRPQLTIVATKPTALVDSSSLGSPAATSTSSTTESTTVTTTISTPTNSTTATADTSTESNKMEHSYIRDTTPKPQNTIEITNGLQPARTILVRRPPQCPSCHTNPIEEDLGEANQATIPSYNEIAAKEVMNECARIAKYVKNTNADDEDWEAKVNQMGWSNMQKNLFNKVVRILDNDQLGRLSNAGRPNEAMQRRVVVDKSASRMRKALASVAWDSRLTQWLHCLLMDCLPSTYMASYLDILQTLKSKLPTLMDKMLFGRPLNVSQELLAPVMKKKWEPQIATKIRKLAHNAVIVALPSMPTSGPVPNRLQKWYQHLATITQIVQVTLPMTSGHISRQPLEQVAEQIVSLTRVKIQELRNENSQRSIILIGFNAGASLALQVAMSENVACVVCMGFAYNTYNGVRGTPDDRILDIKVPILFVIGQNSARSSPEEIESLREKMQSESSLVVVGSADDVLRVPKSRRKIENVTQSMVDTMVVDEVYDFIKRILTNPPGPRTPTVINSTFYAKLNKTNVGDKTGVYQRKRKNESGDQDATPAKSKHIIGRPRTRPLVNTTTTVSTTGTPKLTQMHTSTPVMVGKVQPIKKNLSPNNLTNDDLNMAIQSLISDTNDTDGNNLNTSTDSNSQKVITNFELVAHTKATPIKTTLINPQQKQLIIGSTPAVGTKIKMIPSNQFVQLKPTPLQSQSKIYTIKTSPVVAGGVTQSDGSTGPRIGSIVTTSPSTTGTGQHIFTLKTPNGQTTQFATAVGGQPKYTVIKNASGNTTLQLSTAKTLHPVTTTTTPTSSSNLDLSNIIDMPILFADNEGNISDTSSNADNKSIATTTAKSGSSGVGQLIISQKIIKEANSPATTATTPAATASTSSGTYVINKPGTFLQTQTLSGTKPNKVVFINRNTMKPCSNIISRTNLAQQLNKYTKVVVTNPKTASSTLVTRPGTHLTTPTTSPIASTVKQINLQALNHTSASTSSSSTTPNRPSGILNVQTKNLPQIQIINNPNATFISTDKPQIRNIVVKPGGLKQLPAHLTTQLLNRNLTVRKLPPGSVTITSSPVPNTTQASTAVVAANASALPDVAADNATSSPASSVSSSASTIQTSPKIITLNPINRTTPTTKSE